MDDLFELIHKQASYSQLVAWMQKHQGGSYQEACLKVNAVMQQYRLRYQEQPASPTELKPASVRPSGASQP